MLHRIKSLQKHSLAAQDGEIGQIQDFLFDDSSWHIRYVVADTSQWLPGRKVLLQPQSVSALINSERKVPAKLTRDQIKESPDINTEKPVSRQQEIKLHEYFGWPYYWPPSGQLNSPIIPTPLITANAQELPPESEDAVSDHDPHLRSSREIRGYKIKAMDGNLGHVEDMIVDDEAWKIRYLVVDTNNWLPGKKVLVATSSPMGDINSVNQALSLQLNRETIKSAPVYDDSETIDRDYEIQLHDYYGLAGYWA